MFIAFLEFSTIFPTVLNTPIMIYLLARGGSGSLDVRGFAGRQTTRRSCPLLQSTPLQKKSYFTL